MKIYTFKYKNKSLIDKMDYHAKLGNWIQWKRLKEKFLKE